MSTYNESFSGTASFPSSVTKWNNHVAENKDTNPVRSATFCTLPGSPPASGAGGAGGWAGGLLSAIFFASRFFFSTISEERDHNDGREGEDQRFAVQRFAKISMSTIWLSIVDLSPGHVMHWHEALHCRLVLVDLSPSPRVTKETRALVFIVHVDVALRISAGAHGAVLHERASAERPRFAMFVTATVTSWWHLYWCHQVTKTNCSTPVRCRMKNQCPELFSLACPPLPRLSFTRLLSLLGFARMLPVPGEVGWVTALSSWWRISLRTVSRLTCGRTVPNPPNSQISSF